MTLQQKPEFRRELLDYIVRHRPVDATFIGLHERDYFLPDLSEAGIQNTLTALGQLRKTILQTPPSRDPGEQLDRQLIEGFLDIQQWELQSDHSYWGNPSCYTGEAIFGVLGLLLASFAPREERLKAAIGRLQSIPEFLAQGCRNLRVFPPAWAKRALKEVIGSTLFLREGIPLLEVEASSRDRLRAAARKALRAFEDFGNFLEAAGPPRSEPTYGCGREALELLLRKGHFLHLLGFDGDSILAYAKEEFELARQRLRRQASHLGGDPQQLLRQLTSLHPSAEDYYSRYTEIWNETRQLAVRRQLLTWPDFRIRYAPRPGWARSAAPYLYFLFYRSPAAFGAPLPHEYLVEPLETGFLQEEQQRVLEAHNDSVIKLNHVIHHGGIGHHVQNWHALRSPSLVGRIAAVDCASRIALFCGGTMAEGWACYATDLMSEFGALSPLEQLAECQSRVRMCARATVDVSLHQGRMTLEEAARFYQLHVGMTATAAESEAVKNSMFPATGLMYLMGSDAIHRLRGEISQARGSSFRLDHFHDEFLSFGSIPVALIRERMLAAG